MADVEPAPDVSMDQGDLDTQLQETKIKKTRNRLPVSCEPCRIRRAKCDRERPHCGACSKRGEMEKCVYQSKGPKGSAKTDDGGPRFAVAETEDRLRHLESMISQVMQNGRGNSLNAGYQAAASNGYGMQPSPVAGPGDVVDTSLDPGQLSAIMADLQELRQIITGDGNAEMNDIYDENTVLLGASTTPSLEFILHQYLPERQEVEAYLATYFRAPFLPIPVIHSGSFQRELQDFWQTRPNTDPIWAGLLFAILSLAAHMTSASTGDGGRAAERFLTASAQCINLGGYTRPKKHLIAALLLLAQSQYTQRLDPSREVRMLIALTSQLAFQAQLHREPPRNLTPFDAEMRRRLWLGARHFEIQVACQFGVPAVIPYNSYDVSPPRNLHDEDISEEMTTLPEGRDWSEPTIVTSFLIKARLMDVLSEVYFRAMSVKADSDDHADAHIMRLDADIRTEHDAIPAKYQLRPIGESYADSEGIIMSRMTLEFMFQKTLCILHRRRMAEGNEHSRKVCIDAACKIIKETTDLVAEFQQGRQLHGKGYILTSTMVNDFLLAGMILCLGVVAEERSSTRRRNNADIERLRKQIDLLRKAHSLCIDLSPRSRGAKRVSETITALFSRLQSNASIDPQLPLSYSMPSGPSPNGNPYSGVGGYLPTPTPSTTMSQERSTSTAGYALQPRYAASQPLPPQGYDYAANIAAAASAEPLPTNTQTYNDPTAAAAAAALFQSSTMGQSTPVSDPIHRYMMDTSGGEEIDWTAFDQYIVNEGVGVGGGGWGGFQ